MRDPGCGIWGAGSGVRDAGSGVWNPEFLDTGFWMWDEGCAMSASAILAMAGDAKEICENP